MTIQPYPYYELKPKTHYFFESVGEKGRVFKIVQFSLVKENIWNLGFGDLQEGLIIDSVITNNQDARKVLQTVAKIAIDFLAQYPENILEIKPVDDKRKRLYNSVFQRYYKDIDPYFALLGTFEGKEESYTPLKDYDFFSITLKS